VTSCGKPWWSRPLPSGLICELNGIRGDVATKGNVG
jgi:hypothetical protein